MPEMPSVGRSSPFTRAAVLRFIRENEIVNVTCYVDLGGSDGALTAEVANLLHAKEVHVVDISDEALGTAASRGLQTHKLDLSNGDLPFPDDYFDFVTMIEVLEHLVDTDHALREVHRVLRPGGCVLISTPNLASWRNRLLLLLGYYPEFAEVSLAVSVSGRRVGVENRGFELGKRHLCLYTLRALAFQLGHVGLKVTKVAGAPTKFESAPRKFPYRVLGYLDAFLSRRASLAPGIVLLAQKGRISSLSRG